MKLKELIEKFNQYNPELEIYRARYSSDGCINEIEKLDLSNFSNIIYTNNNETGLVN